MKTLYTQNKGGSKNKKSWINSTALFSWITVVVVTMMFWSGIAFVYKHDYVSQTITKLEHKEDKFLASHKTLHKKLSGIRISLS